MISQDRMQRDLTEAAAAYDLWSFLAWQDTKIRYRRSKIGPFWITLNIIEGYTMFHNSVSSIV